MFDLDRVDKYLCSGCGFRDRSSRHGCDRAVANYARLYSYIAQNECHTCHRSPTIIFAMTTLFRLSIAT
ncbi:hypothetical protein, partial [Chamaesiphon sp. OTE_8_metabat_110]|uniref:hypothetical protein n=1 Tax=Chamaesiphon sp. OTE_8_metabat_110 TaxID=2964696 RepID=UPI00286BA89C